MEEKQECKNMCPKLNIYRNMMYCSCHLNTGNKVFI